MSPSDILKLRRIAAFVLLGAAFLVWGTAIMMSPHGEAAGPQGVDHVKATVAVFARNAAIGTLVLVMAATALLYWKRRPRRTVEDAIALALILLFAATSFYQLFWLETDVLDLETAQAAPMLSAGT